MTLMRHTARAVGAREELRRKMTPAEKILWEELPPTGTFGGRINWESTFEGSKLHLHLRASAGVQGFIVDFYCHKAGLVVEVDGDIHNLQKEEAKRREKVLNEMGLRVVRFRNDEVVRDLSHRDATRSAVVGKTKNLFDQ